MSITVDEPARTTSDARAATSPIDIGIAVGSARDAAVTVRGPIDPEGAATVSELVRALVTTGAVHVIVDLEGSVGLGGDVTRLLEPVGAALRAGGGWLMIAGDDVALSTTPSRGSDLEDAFSAYLAVRPAPQG